MLMHEYHKYFGHSGCVCPCVANDITIMHYLYLYDFHASNNTLLYFFLIEATQTQHI